MIEKDNWKEKVVLITGGCGGVAMATARLYLTEGARVVLADINGKRLSQVASILGPLGGALHTCVSDITHVGDCEATINETVRIFGGLDILINAAGVWVEGESEKSTEEEWDWCMDVNLKGTYFMCSRAIPELKKTQGSIVNLSSDAGVLGDVGAAIYCASKGGVSLMTKALSIELAPNLINVNAVCPSDIMTPMLQYQADTYGSGDPEGYFKALLTRYPQGEKARFIQPEEIAALIFYLTTTQAAPITGACLNIDFGSTAGLYSS